jgi:hypothetical protein
MINVMITINQTFLDLVMTEPTFSPIGVIDSSTPTLKNSIPTIKSTAPTKKVNRMLGGIGAMEKHSSNTMPKIGKTAFRVSDNFSFTLD